MVNRNTPPSKTETFLWQAPGEPSTVILVVLTLNEYLDWAVYLGFKFWNGSLDHGGHATARIAPPMPGDQDVFSGGAGVVLTAGARRRG